MTLAPFVDRLALAQLLHQIRPPAPRLLGCNQRVAGIFRNWPGLLSAVAGGHAQVVSVVGIVGHHLETRSFKQLAQRLAGEVQGVRPKEHVMRRAQSQGVGHFDVQQSVGLEPGADGAQGGQGIGQMFEHMEHGDQIHAALGHF